MGRVEGKGTRRAELNVFLYPFSGQTIQIISRCKILEYGTKN